MSDAVKQSRRRPRFSLLNLLFLMTVVGMAVGIWRATRLVEPLQLENRRLKAELGYAELKDPGKLAFRVAPASLEMHRHLRCHVYVPSQTQGIAELTIASETTGENKTGKVNLGLPAGESTFDLFIYRDAVGDRWRYTLSSPSPGVGRGSTGGPMPPWFADDGRSMGMQYEMVAGDLAVGESAELLSRATQRGDGSLVDLRLRIHLESTSSGP